MEVIWSAKSFDLKLKNKLQINDDNWKEKKVHGKAPSSKDYVLTVMRKRWNSKLHKNQVQLSSDLNSYHWKVKLQNVLLER